MQTFRDDLNNFKKQDQQEYGIAVFDIDFKTTKNGVLLFGEVLTENQKSKVLDLAKKGKIEIVKDNIKVLGDANKRYEIGWAVVRGEAIDLKLRFVSNKILNEKILKRIRCSQAFRGETLRILFKNEDQLLIQQNDLTLGWVNRSEVVLKKESLYKKWAQKFHTLGYGSKNKIIITGVDKNKVIKEAEKYIGAPYLLGGKTKNGIDCSGLIQVVYKNSLDIILPKHSWDQKEVGKKVDLKNLKTGDLIFLIKKSNKHKHVGIVEVVKSSQFLVGNRHACSLQEAVNLIHASLDQKKVVRQSLDEVFENYEFVEVRRIVE